MRTTNIWRDRKFSHWTVNTENLTICHRRYGYEIDLEKCRDSAEILDWIFQLLRKSWMTEESMIELLLLINAILDPQKNFCSFGLERGPLPSAKLQSLLRENIDRWMLRQMHNNGGQI